MDDLRELLKIGVNYNSKANTVASEVVNGGVNGGVYGGVNGGVNGPVVELLNAIKNFPGKRVPELSELTGIRRRTVERYLKDHLSEHVEFRGAPKPTTSPTRNSAF